jgi:uncharacterized membrane protein
MGSRKIIKYLVFCMMAFVLLSGCATSQPMPENRSWIAAGLRELPLTRQQAFMVREFEEGILWTAFGTEPFWAVRQVGDSLFFSTPDFRFPLGFALDQFHQGHFDGTNAGGGIRVQLEKADCSDQMNDTLHVFSSAVWMWEQASDTLVQHGCARMTPDFFLQGLWEINHLEGYPESLATASWAFIELDLLNGRLRGRTPAGLYSRSVFASGQHIQVGDFEEASEIPSSSTALHQALTSARSYQYKDNTLELHDVNGNLLIRCSRMYAD